MTVVTTESRRRLAEIRERTHDARKRQRAAEEAIALARKGGDQQAERSFQDALAAASQELGMATTLENRMLAQLAGVSGIGDVDTIFDDPHALAQLEQLASSTMPVGNVNLGPILSRDGVLDLLETGEFGSGRKLSMAGPVSSPDLPGSARFGPFYGVVPQLRRRLKVLDLIPSMPMEGVAFPYAIESGSLDFAAETNEWALKPMGDQALSEGWVVARTIPAYSKIARQQLADVPQLQQTVASRLSYGVRRRLESQILAGDGVGENLLGILHTTGIATPAFVADTALTDLTLTGITDVMLAEAEPDAVIVNPTDWSTMLAAKAVGSGERLDSDGALSTPGDQLWGLPLIVSTAVAPGTALVGDFSLGCCLFVREGLMVRLSDSDQDDFVRNRCTLLAEMRAGFAVWQPAAFAVVAFA
jgi:hypothetical protein